MRSPRSQLARLIAQPATAVLVGAGLRLLLLGSKSLWLDEILSVRAAHVPLAEFIGGDVERYHPPLYFLLLRQWLKLGESAFHLRLLSVIAGVIAVMLVHLLSKALIDREAAVSATWLAALSPLLVWYAQEARDYSLLLMLVLLSLVALVQYLMSPRLCWLLLFSVATAAATYTHYAGIVALVLQALVGIGLWAASRTRVRALVAMTLGWGIAVVLSFPWLRTPAAGKFLALLRSDRFWMEAITVGRGYLPNALERSFKLAPTRYALILAIFTVVCLAGASAAIFWVLRRHPSWLSGVRCRPVLRVSLFVGYVAVLVLSVIPRGYTIKRYSLVLWPVVLVGAGWFWPWCRKHRMALAGLLLLSAAASLVNVVMVPKAEWDQAAGIVLSEQRPGDVVILSPSYVSLPFDYYAQGSVPVAGVRGGNVAQTLRELAAQYERIWFVAHTTDVGPHRDAIRAWLDQNMTAVLVRDHFRVDVRLYDTP